MTKAILATLFALCFVVLASALDQTPSQVHIALAGAADIRVAWKTADAAPSMCVFGASPTSLNQTASGTSTNYIGNGGWHHVVKLAGLPYASKVYYSCGNGADFMSIPFGVTTAPKPAWEFAPFTMAIFGDMGWRNASVRPTPDNFHGLFSNWSATQTQQYLSGLTASGAIDMVWHVGDISYADVRLYICTRLLLSPQLNKYAYLYI